MTENFASNTRKNLLYFLVFAAFLVYTVRLFQMQVLEQKRFDEKSSGNSIKAIEQTPLRGVFYDRNYKLVVENTPAYTVRIIPAEYERSTNHFLETVLDLDSGYIDNLLYRNRIYSRFVPLKVKRGVDFSAIAWIEENSEYLHGVDYIIEMQRNYPAGIMASHIFGYSKEITPEQLKRDSAYYNPGDLIGYNGIERSYEELLRGTKGYNFVLVDSRRREVGKFKDGINDIVSVKGKDLVLSLDADVQKAAEEAFIGRSGAAVAIEPSTGEVIAMVSAPGYDLNEFSYVTSKNYLQKLYTDPQKPQFNRATSAKHPPGSTFKVFCALAALDLGVINENTTLFCGGGYTFGRFFKCHGSHGVVNVTHAIEKSCNTFFYQLIFKIGLDRLAEYANRFGMGVKTGIDIFEESPGLIPTSKYYERIYGKNWPQGILVSLGIGQGEISVTPLQLAFLAALTANNGHSYEPHLVKGYLDENKVFHPLKFNPVNTGVKEKVFDIVKNGMYLVVNGAGTARSIRMENVNIAGKTGTAQNPHGKDHALFIGFAPYEKPQIAIAVLVENIGFGGTHAAPIARKMIDAYLNKDKNNNPEVKSDFTLVKIDTDDYAD